MNDKEQAIHAVLIEGARQNDVARRFNLSPQTLSRWVIAAKNQLASGMPAQPEPGPKPLDAHLGCIVFGAMLSHLRRERMLEQGAALTPEQFALRLGISSATLRNLESAQKAPPQTSLAYPLAIECSLFLPMMFLVIGFVRAYDASASFELADALGKKMRQTEPRLGFLIDQLEAAVKLPPQQRKVHLTKPQLIKRLVQLCRSHAIVEPSQSSGASQMLAQVSPVLVDAIMALSEKLQLFHPVLNEAGLNAWEEANSHRIRRVFSYYADPVVLLDTIDGFSCKFLRTSNAGVKYILFLKDASVQQLAEIRRKLRTKLSAYSLDEQSVVARQVGDERAAAFDAMLQFDVDSSRMVDSPGAHTIQMTTMNLYELELRLPEGTALGQMHCAFVDNAVTRRGRSFAARAGAPMFFARALRSFDTDQALPLFHATANQFGIEL